MAFVGSAQAAITAYTTQASYFAAHSAPGVDTFDNLDPTAVLSTPQSRTAGSYSYSTSVAPNSFFFPAASVGGDVWLSADDRKDTITLKIFLQTFEAWVGTSFALMETVKRETPPSTSAPPMRRAR